MISQYYIKVQVFKKYYFGNTYNTTMISKRREWNGTINIAILH